MHKYTINIFTSLFLVGILTLSLLTLLLSSVGHVLAQCESSLSLGAFPNKGTVGTNTGTLPVSLSGKLLCGGTGVDKATITVTGSGIDDKHLTTNEFGSYSVSVHLDAGKHTIEAHYDGDQDHSSASASRTITVSAPTT